MIISGTYLESRQVSFEVFGSLFLLFSEVACVHSPVRPRSRAFSVGAQVSFAVVGGPFAGGSPFKSGSRVGVFCILEMELSSTELMLTITGFNFQQNSTETPLSLSYYVLGEEL